MVLHGEDRAKIRRQQTELAIQMAMEGRWEEAVNVNRSLIAIFPNDVDAHNRLGKAMTEQGRYAKAREAYAKALELDPHNAIARRNLTRLGTLGEETEPREAVLKLAPEMFIEEMGKTGVITLLRPNLDAAARLTSGDRVFLSQRGGILSVEGGQGEYLGDVEPRLAQRLLRLMEGGNEYVAAITAISDGGEVRVFIRETVQHPSQAGKLSFPPTATEAFRPYVKERLLRQDVEERYFEEGEEEWEGASEAPETDVTSYQFDTGDGETLEEE
jgi:hypothetical protein